MNLNPDDPRLTAYALGELPESERAAIEAELQHSPECRKAVEEIQQTAKLLSQDLATEPCPELLPTQKEAITAKLESAKIVEFPRRAVATPLAAIAACLLVGLAALLWVSPKRKAGTEKELAARFPAPTESQGVRDTQPSVGSDDSKAPSLHSQKVSSTTPEKSATEADQ